MITRPRARHALLLATVVAGLVALQAPHARAQSAPASAPSSPDAASPAQRGGELKLRGDAAMDARRYVDALEAYTESYAVFPNPTVLYNRARVEQALGRYPDALADLEAFARDAPPELRAKVPKLDALLSDVRTRVATLDLACNVAGARVVVRDVVVGTTPLERPLALNAGRAVVEVSAEGHTPVRREVTLPGGGATKVDVDLVALARPDGPHASASAEEASRPPSERAAEGSPSVFTRWWFWTAVGVAAAGAATVVIVSLQERSPEQGTIGPGQLSAPLVRF